MEDIRDEDMVETEDGWVTGADYKLLAREDRRIEDVEEYGVSGPDAERILNDLDWQYRETQQARLARLHREAAAADADY